MSADLHENDPKAIWQKQRTETSTMSTILIRQKAREIQARRRRQVLSAVLVPISVAFFYSFWVRLFPHTQGAVHLLFVVALIWSMAGTYFLCRGTSSEEMPGHAGFSTGLEFCRRATEQQLTHSRSVLLWSFGPILLAMGTLILAMASATSIFPKEVPLIALAVVWIATYLFIRARQERDLRRELDELNEIDKATH